jgi:hypothetical protein
MARSASCQSRGEGEDVGRHRVTFWTQRWRVRLTCDADGTDLSGPAQALARNTNTFNGSATTVAADLFHPRPIRKSGAAFNATIPAR